MPTERCTGCGALLGDGYASRAFARTPDGRGVLCGSCAKALGRASATAGARTAELAAGAAGLTRIRRDLAAAAVQRAGFRRSK